MKAGSVATLVLLAVLFVSRPSAYAQQPPPTPPPQPPPSSLTVPNPLAGQPPVSLTVPNPLSGLQPAGGDLYRSPDGSDRFQQGALFPPPPVMTVPGPYIPGPFYFPYAPYGPYGLYGVQDPRVPRRRVVIPRGALVVETLPDAAQVFVDGFYAGLAEEFGLRGRPLDLAVGAHRVEVRAAGYEPMHFSVMIAPNEIVRYRGDMQPTYSAAPPRPIPQPAVQKSVYVIPNCYAGDRPPRAALPRGCDPKKLQTRK